MIIVPEYILWFKIIMTKQSYQGMVSLFCHDWEISTNSKIFIGGMDFLLTGAPTGVVFHVKQDEQYF
jgi:hypothetical protein